MPFSFRSRFRHEEKSSPKGVVRIRTKREGEHEVRLGITASGQARVISVLHPKGERRRPRARSGRKHAHPHGSRHHRGACPPSCRHGRMSHGHRGAR